MKLWITAVDSAGKPLSDHVVFDGPIISVPFGDGVHPIKIQYYFDPPIQLPARGQYFFAIQEMCSGWFDLLISLRNAYAGGSLWRTERSNFSGCVLRIDPDQFVDYDLVFTMEFCQTGLTPVRGTSWGRLKAMYR